ncbi:hypothetical protein PBV87_12785 [Niameybacter massiliensis]|uniref:Uncharacterized protein n=1 Tax=Holtiella tumoricola TaxID=3018743 RepID=A0AA42J1D3_9FIRM|nr:hypothetical protein [Holtiella tumoricola]MDA3732364.1 hypothetical protein [Holtiella tumoricola]
MKRFKPYQSKGNAKSIAKMTIEVADKIAQEKVQRDREAFGNIAIRTIVAASMITLHDEFGFGSQRLQRYQDRMEEHLECINSGVITLQELEETTKRMEEKANLNLKEKTEYTEWREGKMNNLR